MRPERLRRCKYLCFSPGASLPCRCRFLQKPFVYTCGHKFLPPFGLSEVRCLRKNKSIAIRNWCDVLLIVLKAKTITDVHSCGAGSSQLLRATFYLQTWSTCDPLCKFSTLQTATDRTSMRANPSVGEQAKAGGQEADGEGA